MKDKKAMLVILDGWGIGEIPEVSAIDQAKTPVMDKLLKDHPNAELVTFGSQVGLPDGQMGNSEVGHLNIGAGRVVYQELARINKAIEEETLHKHPKLIQALERAAENGQRVQLMGLLSDGGVHSHINHLLALTDIVEAAGVKDCFIHAFTDGRDVSPKSGVGYIEQLEAHIKDGPTKLATVVGRYYAMDRDSRWERIKLAYDLLVKGVGEKTMKVTEAINHQYAQDKTDEFLEPIQCIDENGNAFGSIQEGDLLLCFNFRTDRPRQISTVLTQKDFPDHEMKKLDIDYITMVTYDSSYEGVTVLFEKDDLQQTIGEVISKAGMTQVRIAETEKYPHVTFFFSGGREEAFEGEKRIMIPSPKVATYDLQPEMSAPELTNAIITEMNEHQPNFVCLNFANTDMVGHTGMMDAAIKATETVDKELGRIIETGLALDYQFIIIADHGNSDIMTKSDGSPHTAHTTNMVPIVYVANDSQGKEIESGKLADVAPTILYLLNTACPEVYDGKNLIVTDA